MVTSILDPVLSPILTLPPVLAIVLISLLISVITLLSYKFLTNQSLMKQLREEINDFQKQMKELRNHPEKAMKVQTRMMETNMKYMTESMKPTLITFIPIILIFGWLNSHLSYLPIAPDTPFDVTAAFKENAVGTAQIVLPEGVAAVDGTEKNIANQQAIWVLKGSEGTHNLTFVHNGQSVSKEVQITNEKEYLPPVQEVKDVYFRSITVGNERMHPFGDFSIFGWKPGWLGTYIIFSLVFSLSLRRIFKIY